MDVATNSDVVITIVTDTPDAERVILGENGVILGGRPGQVVIDMSTISPEATRRMADELKKKEMTMLDAPVTGGEIGAINGTLTIMVGGDRKTFEETLPILQAMGKKVIFAGPSGAGQTIKLCNQVLCAVNQVAVSEAVMLAAKAGADLSTMLEVTTSGAGGSWALENLGRKVVAGDLKPAFMIRLMQKDLALVMELARKVDLPLPGTVLANQLLRAVEAEAGGKELGTQAMIKAYERLASFKLPKS
jgi:3-hydroxyisobutyrate dehydrogenase